MEEYIIYGITDGDKVVYVGYTKNFERRRKEHFQLKSNTMTWLRYIKSRADMIVLDKVDNKTDAIALEDYYIIKYDTINSGYNQRRSGFGYKDRRKEFMRLREHTEERKAYKKQYRSTDEYKARKKEIDRRHYLKKKMGA